MALWGLRCSLCWFRSSATRFWRIIITCNISHSGSSANIPQAVSHLKQAIAYVPIHAAYHRTFGELYLAAFRNAPTLDAFYEGYQSFTRAIQCNPRDYDAYQQLGNLHREMFSKKLRTRPTAQNALEAYQQALQYKLYDPFILYTMAMLHADLDEFEQAIALLQQAVTLEPNFVSGYQMLGKMFAHLGRQAEAQQAFQQAEKNFAYLSTSCSAVGVYPITLASPPVIVIPQKLI